MNSPESWSHIVSFTEFFKSCRSMGMDWQIIGIQVVPYPGPDKCRVRLLNRRVTLPDGFNEAYIPRLLPEGPRPSDLRNTF